MNFLFGSYKRKESASPLQGFSGRMSGLPVLFVAQFRRLAPAMRQDATRVTDWRQHALVFLFFAVFFAVFFSPALLSGHMLAPGDGVLQYLAHYQMPRLTWNARLMTGFPDFADPQVMLWYGPAIILSRVPGSWNWFVIGAYVLAAWFAYLYLRAITTYVPAALVGGLMFGLSGFLMGHLGHVSIIHTACWIPCMLWASEKLAQDFRLRWVLVGGLAGTECILGGHPQVALYGFALLAAHVAFRGWARGMGRSKYALASAAAIGLAVLLSSVQLLSTAAFASQTTRARLTFSEFSSFSPSVFDVALFAFPCLFGGAGALYFDGIPFFADWNLTEVIGYIGFASFPMTLIAITSAWRNKIVVFWACLAGIAFTAALGPTTPVGRILFELPGFGQFRCQGRFFVVFDLAMSILAALGMEAIARSPSQRRHFGIVLASLAGFLAFALSIGPLFGAQLRATAAHKGIANFPVEAWKNRWILIPVLNACVLSAILILFIRRPKRLVWKIALIAGVAWDLSTFAWFAEWRFWSPKASEIGSPAVDSNFIEKSRLSGGRWLAVRGSLGALAEGPPDLGALWGLSLTSKYGPMLPTRYRDLLQVETNGSMLGNWWEPLDLSLDVTGTRFLALPMEGQQHSTEVFQGIAFPSDEFSLVVGRGCGATALGSRLTFPLPKHATNVALVSLMGCSPGYEQGTPVAELNFQTTDGRTIPWNLKAGVETAEWAATCADVAHVIRHRSAVVYSRFPVPRSGDICEGQKYAAVLNLSETPIDIEAVGFRWLPQGVGNVRIVKLVFTDDRKDKIDPVTPRQVWFGDPAHWKQYGETGGVSVYENLRSMPRAWLVPETVSLTGDDVKKSIQSSRLPDGREYNPASVALIEEPLGFHQPSDPQCGAWIVDDEGTALEVQTKNQQSAFLVLGDLYYPGWQAFVNGRPAKIFRTNYIQRGVLLPSGQNIVRFEFHPHALYAGLGLSAVGVLFAIIAAVIAGKRGWI